MNIKQRSRTLLCCLSLLPGLCFAGDLDEYDKKIEEGTRRLKELEKQIVLLQSEEKKIQQQEKGLIREMDNTDRQISLTTEKIRLQNRELQLRRSKQAQLKKDYQNAETHGAVLIGRYKDRIVRAYKMRPARQWDLFIDANSPREFYYRIKYITAINSADRKLYHEILDNMKLIDLRRKQISDESRAIEGNVSALQKEQKNLEKLKSEKADQYDKIKTDKVLIAQQIQEKEKSIKEIQSIIEKTQKDKKAYLVRLEEERKKREIVQLPFIDKKGKLPWPARGEIVSAFGKQTHPVLGTVTENSGIDIRTASGTPVTAVSDGLVVTVTWLRGYGNTIIVMHDGNFYTVYSHVEDIRVVQDEYVDAGQHLATVSNDGSMDGTRLHFELWQEQQKLNPRTWLGN
ncbi:MAG: peptidoglycan DD-metalloendopeptidase family protein [Candidatus Marinimicrobia bacterium]|nr:peptidoglycan DD-metalloendopeptidase family protein [Candidatus Neomarinimicrobiota bacterium]